MVQEIQEVKQCGLGAWVDVLCDVGATRAVDAQNSGQIRVRHRHHFLDFVFEELCTRRNVVVENVAQDETITRAQALADMYGLVGP